MVFLRAVSLEILLCSLLSRSCGEDFDVQILKLISDALYYTVMEKKVPTPYASVTFLFSILNLIQFTVCLELVGRSRCLRYSNSIVSIA